MDYCFDVGGTKRSRAEPDKIPSKNDEGLLTLRFMDTLSACPFLIHLCSKVCYTLCWWAAANAVILLIDGLHVMAMPDDCQMQQ